MDLDTDGEGPCYRADPIPHDDGRAIERADVVPGDMRMTLEQARQQCDQLYNDLLAQDGPVAAIRREALDKCLAALDAAEQLRQTLRDMMDNCECGEDHHACDNCVRAQEALDDTEAAAPRAEGEGGSK